MAIDPTQPVRINPQPTGIIRHGMDDGNDFALGTLIVEESNGTLRLQTSREADNYVRSNAEEAAAAELANRATAIDVPAPTPLAIKEYLKAKFPGDFAS